MADPVSAGLIIGGTALKAYGSYKKGKATKKAAKREAAQIEENARNEFGAGVTAAAEERRKGKIAISDATTAIAAGGGVASDEGSIELLARTQREADYNSLARLFDAQTGLTGNLDAARARRKEGKNAARAGLIGAGTSALSGAVKGYDSYNSPEGVAYRKSKGY